MLVGKLLLYTDRHTQQPISVGTTYSLPQLQVRALSNCYEESALQDHMSCLPYSQRGYSFCNSAHEMSTYRMPFGLGCECTVELMSPHRLLSLDTQGFIRSDFICDSINTLLSGAISGEAFDLYFQMPLQDWQAECSSASKARKALCGM